MKGLFVAILSLLCILSVNTLVIKAQSGEQAGNQKTEYSSQEEEKDEALVNKDKSRGVLKSYFFILAVLTVIIVGRFIYTVKKLRDLEKKSKMPNPDKRSRRKW